MYPIENIHTDVQIDNDKSALVLKALKDMKDVAEEYVKRKFKPKPEPTLFGRAMTFLKLQWGDIGQANGPKSA